MKIKNKFFKIIAKKNYKEAIHKKKIERILIIRDGGIGDAICTFPLLRELKKNFPLVEIDIYASLNNYTMYQYVPYVNNVYVKYKKRQWLKTWIEIFRMRSKKYSLAIDDTVIRLHRTIYTMIINPKYVIGSSDQKKRYGFDRSSLSYYYKTYNSNILEHIVNKRMKVLDLLEIYDINYKMEFFLPKEDNQNIIKYLKEFKNRKIITLNTEGSNDSRTLNKEQIIQICKCLEHQEIIIIPFSLPSRYKFFEDIIVENKIKNLITPYKTKNIYEAAEILKNSNLLISPDTSFIHIASGLNVPTIGLFWDNPIKYLEWGPKSDLSYAIKNRTKESNLKDIDIEEIRLKVFEILNLN